MSSVDLRGFRFAAEPLLLRRRWELEALQAALGRLQRRIGDARQALDALEAQRAAQLEAAAAPRAIDLRLHATRLHWLVQLKGRMVQARAELEGLQAERADLVAQSIRLQQKTQALEAGRAEALRRHAQAEAARMAGEADRDWLARREVPA